MKFYSILAWHDKPINHDNYDYQSKSQMGNDIYQFILPNYN